MRLELAGRRATLCPVMKALLPALLLASVWNASATPVHVQIIDKSSGAISPAMACLTDAKGQVRLPPDGRLLETPSSTREFYSGVDYDADPTWIGPVRKMQGRGDNDDRSYVYEDRPSIPYWQEPVMYQVSGDFRIELPEGRYRLAVEHGMEYVPQVKTFEVQGTGEQTIRFALARWIDLPSLGWWSGDVHVHHPTATQAQRDYLLSYAQASDLHVVNVLEMGHHQGTDFKQAGFGADARVHREDYWLVSGQEDPRSTFGHIIGLNLSGMVRDLSTYDFYDLTFRRIHEQPGALVGFAHLAWNGCDLPRGFPWYVTTGELDFVELLQFGQVNQLDYYDYLNLGFRLAAAAGSDTPWGSTIGEVRTYVHTGPQLDIDAWFAGLKQGHTFVSNGPVLEFTVNSQLPGSEIHLEPGQQVRIQARVTSHPAIGHPIALTLNGNRGVIREAAGTGSQTTLQFTLDRTIDQSQWLVLSTLCDNGALAHTTPVYVVVNERPTWCPEQGPSIIHRQLTAIQSIADEFDPSKGTRETGIHHRLDEARRYYHNLLERMKQ